jgi:hypothetical protein
MISRNNNLPFLILLKDLKVKAVFNKTILVFLLVFQSSFLYAQIAFVYQNATVGNDDGSSRTDAYSDLQTALASAVVKSDNIRVADKKYKPTSTTDRTISFTKPGGVKTNSGFAGNESQLHLLAPLVQTLPLFEGFESGLVKFNNAAGNSVNWAISTDYYHSGSQSVRNQYTNSNTQNILVETDIIDLTGRGNAYLEFWHIAKTEGTYDKCYVEVSIDGGTNYTSIPASAYQGSSADYASRQYFHEDSYALWGTGSETPNNATWWKQEKFSLAAYNFNNVKIRFRLTSDVVLIRDGWIIDDIRITTPPVITSFSPLAAKPGDAVTITGAGFNTTNTNNIVFFGATKAVVTAASATSLTLTVPAGATYAPISLLNTGTELTAYSPSRFTPTYSPAKIAITPSDFLPKQDFATDSSPYSVAIGDLDGDGKPDLAVANQSSNTVSVYYNTSSSGSIGTGSFAAKQDFATGSSPYSVAIGDLDGDGKPDLAVANYGSTSVSVLRNTSTSGGNVNFAAKQDFATGSGPFSVVIGDLDGDGKPDLAVANFSSNTVSVLRNTSASGGTVSFAAKQDFATGSAPFSVVIGDLDGDGKPDLAVARLGSNNVSVFRNTSTSGVTVSFAAKQDFTTGINPYSVAIGDLDGDGKPDLAVTNSNSATVSVLRNTSTSIGTVSFAAKQDFTTGSTPYSVAIGDLDGDGKPDLAVANLGSNSVSVLRNTSTSGVTVSFAARQDFATGSTPYSVAIGDLDGDGKPDLAVANKGSASVSVLRNSNLPPPTITSFVPISGKPGDVVSLTGTNFNTTPANNIVFFGATRAVVTVASANSLTVTVPAGATYASITALNTGTGLASFSGANFTPIFSPAKTTITPSDFLPKQDFTTGDFPSSVAIGDLDGDGKPDLAVANQTANTVSVYYNTSSNSSIGTGSFAAKQDFATGSSPYSVAIGDLDGDGKPDLAVANAGSNNVSVLRNTSTSGGTVNFAARQDFATGSSPVSVAIGDLDGDGKPDLAVTNLNLNSNTVSVLRNTSASGGTVSFAAKQDFTTGSFPYSVAIGDLDGDGKPDLAVANYFSDNVSVLRNTSTSIGTVSFAVKQDFTTDTSPRIVAIGDLDGDGKPDLAVANAGSNSVSVLRNTSTSGGIGTGSFAVKQDFTTGTGPVSVAIGDLDGDGQPDLAVANYSSNSVSVLRNTSTSGGIGTVSFAAKQDFATGTDPFSVAIGDLDGDGKPDLAVANGGSNNVSVLRNAANNADLSALALSVGSLSPSFAAATTAYTADVGNTTNSINVTPTPADANATVTVNDQIVTSGAASANINLNVGQNTLTILVTAENGSTKTYSITVTRYEEPPVISSFTPLSAKPGDAVTITGTGFNTTPANNIVFFGATRAVVTVASANSLTVIVPSGATYAPITALNTGTDLASFSGANFTPIFSPAKTAITPSDFLPKQDFTTGSSSRPYSVAIGDLDGDGKPDLTVANESSNTVSVYYNTSSNGSIGVVSFAAKQDFTTGSRPYSVAIGDLDGDGKPDLAVTNSGSNTVSVLRNTSTSGSIGIGSFAAKQDFTTTGTNSRIVAIGDLDGDGKPDLAVTNSGSNTVSVLRNTSTSIGTVSFTAKQDFATGTDPYSVAIGDLNGDGKPDLAVANLNSDNVSVLRNTSTSIGTVSFAAKQDFATGTTPFSVAIGDLDGDGKPDLAVANLNFASVSVLRNTSTSGGIGTGSFAARVDFATGFGPRSVAIGDLDGDGQPDLAVANGGSNTVSVLRNTSTSGGIGTGSFAAKQDFTTGFSPISVAIGDLDGDGKPDLAVANLGSNTVSVLRNAANNADLSALAISAGSLSPGFAAATTAYTADVGNTTNSINVTPTPADANATVTVNDQIVTSGAASANINLNKGGNTTITVAVTAENAIIKNYTISLSLPCQNQETLVSPSDDYTTGNVLHKASSATGKIIGTNKLTDTSKTTYQAKVIELNAGFKADNGTVFTAEIGGCN